MVDTNSSVQYRKIPGFPGYRVGSDGSMWSRWRAIRKGDRKGKRYLSTRKPMKQSQIKRGVGNSYYCVGLRKGKKVYTFRVHRLVLLAFIGPCPEGMECRHLDGNPTNNSLSNLCWGTRLENAQDKRRLGRKPKRNQHQYTKLTNSLVHEIRKRYDLGGISQYKLCHEYNISYSHMSEIVNRKVWKHFKVELTESQVREIREIYNNSSISQAELAKVYQISASLIKKIINKKVWKHLEGTPDNTRLNNPLKGEQIRSAKLTESQVREIRERYARGNITHRKLAKEYKISKNYISEIVNKKVWKHLEDTPDNPWRNQYLKNGEIPQAKLTESQVREIRELFAQGNITKTDLARKYQISDCCIGKIIHRKTWTHI